MEHAILSASGSTRWLNCNPSARLEEKYNMTQKFDNSSVYAEEGTLAHDLGELFLLKRSGQIDPPTYNSEIKKIKKHKLYKEEMLEYVEVYSDYVMETYNEARSKVEDSILLIEEKLDFSQFVPEGFGTGDTVIISDGVLDVMDLKYGKGIQVYAEENPQMMLYGLGALDTYDMLYDIHTVALTIVQPRLNHIDTWHISVKDLLKWGNKIVKPAAKTAHEGEGIQFAGDWCRWCKVKGMCATLAAENVKLAKLEFADPHLLTNDQILQVFNQIPMLVDWAAGVSAHMLKEALTGTKWPGLKIVEGRSYRKWDNEKEVVKVLEDNDYKATDFMKSKLEGVPGIQKLLKDSFNELLSSKVVKPPGKPTLVKQTDKRQEFCSLESDFTYK